MFLYQKWLARALKDFLSAPGPVELKGKAVLLSPQQYGAALMQAYFGKSPLAWIAQVMDLPEEVLKKWRREPHFLYMMDWSKVQFAEVFQEDLILNDYTPAQCCEIAGEFFLLEDSLKIRVRMQLYGTFRNLGERLVSRRRHGIPLERYDLALFRRLLLFFLALEVYWPSAAGKQIREQFIPLAREVAWSGVNLPPWGEEELAVTPELCSLPKIRQSLEAELKETFAHLSLMH